MILALPHMGNWDVGRGLAGRTTATRSPRSPSGFEPESLFDRFVAFRESLGMEVLPLTGGDAVADARCSRSGCAPGAWSACSPTGT